MSQNQSSDTKLPEAYNGIEILEVMDLAVNYNSFLLRQIQRRANKSDHILDFGSGAGQFAVAMREDGYNVTCLEPDPELAARLTDKGFSVISSLDQAGEDVFDYIYTVNVLEHIEDDAASVSTLHKSLKPEGYLFVYVPAFQVLYSSMDRKVGHFRRYRHHGLKALLTGSGFQIHELRYTDSLGFLASLLFKLVGNDEGDINPKALVLYDRVAFPLSRLFDHLAGRFIGKNLLSISQSGKA